MAHSSAPPIPDKLFAYLAELSKVLHAAQCTEISGHALALEQGAELAIDHLLTCKAQSGKAMLVGNGGSAAIVSHAQNDLMKAVGLRAVVFNEAPLLTALTNDDGYEQAFETLIAQWVDPGDLVIAVSSSGQSENILRAVRAARAVESHILSFSGFHPDNPLRQLGDINFYVSSESYGFVEMSHAALLHYITDVAMMRGQA